ncbi:kinase-like protein, partial [Saccharata proteae CBS 121410]
WYLPQSKKETLITIPAVIQEIENVNRDMSPHEVRRQARETIQEALNLFATLAILGKGGHIVSFLKEGISDRDLPFIKESAGKEDFDLQREDKRSISSFESWTTSKMQGFFDYQWAMIAPVFEPLEHYVFQNRVILPFESPFDANDGRTKLVKDEGGYSQVFIVRIHHRNHHFKSDVVPNESPKVAIKQLRDSNRSDFEKERDVLRVLGIKSQPHPHLSRLLASYEHKEKFHFIFPCANSNLREYWEERPSPLFDKDTVLWSLKQMAGFADALWSVHNFKVSAPVKRYDPEMRTVEGEELFGRHGDIKPENILWYERVPDGQDSRGVFQITDFGLGRFHGKDSRTKPAYNISCSPTYQPPENKLHRPVSRKYDVWSLGCLYVEFVTWLLIGNDQIEGFSDERGEGKINTNGISDDNFFSTTHDGVQDAVVRPEVITWTDRLHRDSKCSQAMHEVINLVMDKMLLIEASDRAEMAKIARELKDIFKKSTSDDHFLLKPTPYPP